MEKDTLGKMIDLYVEKELEKQTTAMAQNLFDLLCEYENCITYDIGLNLHVVSNSNYNRIRNSISLLKRQLIEKYNVDSKE